MCNQRLRQPIFLIAIALISCSSASGQLSESDQHGLQWHTADQISTSRRVPGMVPVTVASKDAAANERLLPLDEAIRIALQHSEVVRILAGTSAISSGRTIYDTAIASTPIDQEIARFDPVFRANSTWRKSERPGTISDFANPLRPGIGGSQTGGNDLSMSLRRRNRLGGTAEFGVGNTWAYDNFGGAGRLSRSHRPSIDLSYTQPLLAGAGVTANEAPIVIARLNRDRSYFQFKGSMQRLVQGVISAYWSLVAARTELWAREKQVEQAKVAFERVEAQFRVGIVNISEVAQPRVALANFKANLVLARGNVIQREAALRNILGFPPEDGSRLVPSTPPTRDRLQFDWTEMVETAQQFRPDLIELHLVLQADSQRYLQAENRAQSTLNAVATQNWNGIRGRALDGHTISSNLNDNPSWTLGLTFEVPLSLRESRANLRNRELLIARDRADIRQGLHATEHSLATTIRNVDQFYEQYEAFRETRAAALSNLEVQIEREKQGFVIFLNVLQAITDWGNAVSAEASSLTQYNTSLATLELETGTILETHAVTFTEERYSSIGAWGKHFQQECYPKSLSARTDTSRYGNSDEPSEEAFELKDFQKPDKQKGDSQIKQNGSMKPVSRQRTVSEDWMRPDPNTPSRAQAAPETVPPKPAAPKRLQGMRTRLKNLFR